MQQLLRQGGKREGEKEEKMCSSEQTLSRKRKRQKKKSSEDLQETDDVRTHSSGLHEVGSPLAKRVKKVSFSNVATTRVSPSW